MSRSTEQIIEKGEVICYYFAGDKSLPSSTALGVQRKHKVQYLVLSKDQFTNEAVHQLSVYNSGKKSGQGQTPIHRVVVTRGNLCGVINATVYTHITSSRSSVVQASPYLAIVTRTGTLVIQQPDGSTASVTSHDKWYQAIKSQLDFVHSWPVQLESCSSHLLPHGDSCDAFLCLNRHTLSVVMSADYSCVMFCTVDECRFKKQSQDGHMLITIKRIAAGSDDKCVIKAISGVATSFLRAVGYHRSDYITPPCTNNLGRDTTIPYNIPPPPPPPRQDSSMTLPDTTWTLIDTFTELYKGERPRPNTLGLSDSCLTQLGIQLSTQPGQSSWRDIAEHIGMSQDDVDMVVRWASSRYNVPRTNPSVLLPATYLLYHWQYVCNVLGIGEPPKMPRPCTKTELKSLLGVIGRNDLVRLLDEWEMSLTRI